MVFPGVLRGLPGPRLATNPTESTTSKPVVPWVCCLPHSSRGRARAQGALGLLVVLGRGRLEAGDDDLGPDAAAERVLLHVLAGGAPAAVTIVAPAAAPAR